MDEIISLILHGCELARELGETLPNLATQPDSLFNSLEKITKIFGSAKERVLHSQDSSSSSYLHNTLTLEHQQIGTSVEQWLRSNPQAMDIIQTQLAADRNEAKISGGIDIRGLEAAVKGSQAVDVVPASDLNIASSSSQRPRQRKDQGLISKMTVPAPRIGNTEIPPEDGFTWRKYGQKEIINSRFPRSYYRCTHQKLYNCLAKKHVQRLDDDPSTFEVTYIGEHTCHMSATAPSILTPTADHHITQDQMAATTEPPTSRWLSMDFNPIRGGSSSGGMIGGSCGGGGDDVGTSTGTRYPGKEVDFPVMDLADAMFNSGSSSSSMDFIFSSAERTWEPDDKKN
ncbi:WRKY transcription factor 55-like [Malus sylvestris]|uniref:WRKY transcription factor 55-like n=1 Tax=Malus sylvestris TaxID=3752 RepID=UPI0021AC5CBC|nr:WRKY transcription factor 55-like [Malus sylvestris]